MDFLFYCFLGFVGFFIGELIAGIIIGGTIRTNGK